jgi:hypothetical protein
MTDETLRLREELKNNYKLCVKILREAGSALEKYDFKNFISPAEKRAAKEKWEKYDTTNDRQKLIFEAAKQGDRTAVNYIWLKVADRNVSATFWKKYLGPSPEFRRRRLEQGAFYDWAAIAYETLTTGNKDYTDTKGALETFDPSFYDHGDLFENFIPYFKLKLFNSANESNYNDSTSGIKGTPGIKGGVRSQQSGGKAYSVGEYDPTYMDSVQEERDNTDPTLDSFINDEEVGDFIRVWKEVVRDPKISTPKSATGIVPIHILKTVIEAGPQADSFSMLVDKYPNVSRNTLSNYLQEVVKTMDEYGIGYSDLMRAIKTLGEDRIVSYIEGDREEALVSATQDGPVTEPTPQEEVEAEEKAKRVINRSPSKAAVKDDVIEKIKLFNDNPHLWTSPRTNKTGTWQAGSLAYYMLKDPKITPEKFIEWNRIPGNWNETTMNRVKKMLKKVGIDWTDIEKMPKKQRDALAELIGSEE